MRTRSLYVPGKLAAPGAFETTNCQRMVGGTTALLTSVTLGWVSVTTVTMVTIAVGASTDAETIVTGLIGQR